MQFKRPISPEDLVTRPTLSDPRLSRDGACVAFVVGEASREGSEPRSAIWLQPVAGDEPPLRLTHAAAHEFAPRPSPDGRTIAFLSDRHEAGKPRIYLIRLSGGEAEQLCALPGEVKDIEWSPDGKLLAALVRAPEPEETARQLKEQDDALVFGADWKSSQVWCVEVAGRTPTCLSDRSRHAVSFAWSPSCAALAVATLASSWADASYDDAHLDILPVAGGGHRRVAEPNGHIANLCWSPDGAMLAFRGPVGRVSTDDAIYIVPACGGAPRKLLPDYIGAIQWIAWLDSGMSMIAAAIEYEASALLRVDTESGVAIPLLPPALRGRGYFGADLSCARDGSAVACVRSCGGEPPELWTGAPDSLRKRTNFNSAVAAWATGRVEPLRWTSSDGTEVSGLLVYPFNYESGRRYPTILHIHGGPTWFWSDHFHADWHDWAQYLASHGYAVLLPNPRGSAGRGAAFADCTLDDYGGKELDDDLAGLDRVIELGIADPERLGIGGWSHGGYMTAWAITQTVRFKAAVMGAGMCNLLSDQGQNDIPRCNDQYFTKRTYEDPDCYMSRSPISFVERIHTPLLIVHGAADDRVNPMQGREFYIALRLLDRTCTHVSYPRERHLFEERKHQADLLRRVLAWYDTYLKAEPAGAQ